MFKVYIDYENGNEAFADDPNGEVIRILRECIKRIESGEECGNLYDINGNRSGDFSF